jgi:hypothetical protein
MGWKIARIAAVAVLVGSVMAIAPMASAGGGDVIRRGSCSARSDWKLKLSPQDGGIEVEFEVDSNVNGQAWRVRITQDGNRIFSGRRVTRAPSGSFEVRTVTDDPAGTDRFRARAAFPAAGEVCVGVASI